VLRITLDTNVVDPEGLSQIETACAGRDVEVKHTTVTDREQGGTSFASERGTLVETGVWDESHWDSFVWGGDVIPETLVLGESRLGRAVLGGDDAPALLEAILEIIGNGQFPPPGERGTALGKRQRRRFRDAMIFQAHCRERRDVFVTNDENDFIRGGKREKLQAIGSTRILTVKEFCEWIEERELEAGGLN
jgi:hypothetical protein